MFNVLYNAKHSNRAPPRTEGKGTHIDGYMVYKG